MHRLSLKSFAASLLLVSLCGNVAANEALVSAARDGDAALHRQDRLIGPGRQNPLQLQGGDAVQDEGGLRIEGGKCSQRPGSRP